MVKSLGIKTERKTREIIRRKRKEEEDEEKEKEETQKEDEKQQKEEDDEEEQKEEAKKKEEEKFLSFKWKENKNLSFLLLCLEQGGDGDYGDGEGKWGTRGRQC